MAMMFRLFSATTVSKARNVSASTAVVAAMSSSRRFNSSTAVIPRACTVSATDVVSKHIQDLSKRSALILKMKERLIAHRTKALNPVEQQLLQSQPRVEHQLQFLHRLYDEIAQSTTTVVDDNAPLTFLTKTLQYLQHSLDLISKTENKDHYHCPAVPIAEPDRIGAAFGKPPVVHEFLALKSVLEDIAYETELALSGAAFEKHDGMTTTTMPGNQLLWDCYTGPLSKCMPPEGTLDKHRYLLVSNGCDIHCLDLKQSKTQPFTHDLPLLPIIASVNLLDEDLPTTFGLCKLRSTVYMIGGQTLSRDVSTSEEDCLQGLNLYADLCKRPDTVKATSRHIHVLSLDDSKTNLSRSESNLLQLSKPKIRPIVEQFHGEIHVIDSLPSELASKKDFNWTGSHEVFDQDSGCLVEELVVPASFPVMGSHLVVGNKIFAEPSDGDHSLVFDSRRNKWHVSPDTSSQRKRFSQAAPDRNLDVLAMSSVKEPRFPKDVMHILGRDYIASSVGGFRFGDPLNPLYVVISLTEEVMEDDGMCGGYLEAFLVNSSGQVLCTQSLKRVFNGFTALKCKIFKVEEDVLQTRRTMCSIVLGSQPEWDECGEYMNNVLINTFDVKEHPDAADKVREVVAKGSKAWPVEMEFVQIEVLDRYVFKTDAELDQGGEARNWVDVQSCFL